MAMDSTVKLVLNVDDQNVSTTLNTIKTNAVGLGGAIVGLAGSTKIINDITSSAVNLGLEFDQTFAKVSTLFGDVEVDTENLKNQILDLSTATGISATQLNEGLYSALSAGIPVTEDMTEAMGFLESSTMLATAGFTTTEKAVDIATTVLNAYGLEVDQTDRVMNTLIETQNAGKTTVDELASSLGKVIPTASTLGVNFEELSASVAVLTANGISTAETMTKLKALFVELNDPASKINTLFEELSGTTFPEFIKQGGSLTEGLQILKKELDKNGETWGQYLSSVEAVDAATILMKDNGDKLSETYARMTDDTYELTGAYEDMQTPGQEIAKITEGFKNELIKMGTAILDVALPALEFLADHIDTVAPLVITLTLAVSGLVAVMATVKIVKTFANGIKLLGTEALTSTKSVAKLGGAIISKLATPWGLALTGMAVVAFAFRDQLAVAFRDIGDSFMELTTGMTESQRDFSKDVQSIQQDLGDQLVSITEENMERVKNGEMTAEEARVQIAEDSVEARLDAERRYNEEFANLQNERYAEEEISQAKAVGKKKELLDASEQELLDLRKEYDEKTQELVKTNAELEEATDEETRDRKTKELEQLNDDLNKIQSDADEEMLLLKAGNRAKDEDDFVSYTDDIKRDLADMSDKEKENYEQRAEVGKAYRDGEYTALRYAHDATEQTFRTHNNELVQVTKDANGNMTTIITDEMGNQVEVTRSKKGEIDSIIKDANGAEIEGTKRQNEQIQKLTDENWTELLTITVGGTDDMESAMEVMWGNILETANTSDKKLQNEVKMSGSVLAQQWLDNGSISVEQYDSMISQLDDVTKNAVDDATRVKDVKVGFDKADFEKAIQSVPDETRAKIKESNDLEGVTVDGVYEMVNTLSDVVNYNPSPVNVPVSYNSGNGTGNGIGPTPQHAKGAIVSGTEYAMVGESGPELILPLNMQGAQFLEQFIPSGGGGGDTITYNVTVVGGGTAQDNVDAFDKAMGRRLNKRGSRNV